MSANDLHITKLIGLVHGALWKACHAVLSTLVHSKEQLMNFPSNACSSRTLQPGARI